MEMAEITCYVVLFLLLLFGIGSSHNCSNRIKDLILAAEVAENSSIPAVPLWHFKDKSYYVGSIVKLNFFGAQQFCSYQGMRLLSITSKEENIFLAQNIVSHGFTGPSNIFWTSGTRLPDDEHWVWLTTGSRLEYNNWIGEPNNVDNAEKCLELNRLKKQGDLYWNDFNCDAKLYFICEYKRPKTLSYVMDRLRELANSADSTDLTIPPV